MSALADLTPADIGILVERPEPSLYQQLAVADFQARAALDRMSAACCDIAAAKLSGHGMPAALALYRSARTSRIAAIERLGELRGKVARSERLGGLIVGPLSRPAAPELRAP